MIFGDERHSHRAFALPGSRPQYGPDKIVEVEGIDLDLKPDLAAETLRATCTTSVRALDETVQRLEMDAVDLTIDSVKRNGAPQSFVRRNGKLEIRFDPPLAPGERTAVCIEYAVTKPRHGLFFIKPTPEHPEKITHAWTQSQDENARFWFPCLDYPHEKQRTSARITVPAQLFALSNGELAERREEGDWCVFSYRQDVPHSTYLMTMVVGPFVEVSQGTAGRNAVPIAFYVLPGREADGERAFGNTPTMLETFEERIGTAYPYARYCQIAVSDFIFGGMENTAATTQTDRTLHDARAHLDFSSDPLVSHELAHQWFGNLLTCRDWSHAWLNEGFATYFEAVWREADLGYDEYLYDIFQFVTAYLQEDAQRYRRAIVCNRYRDPIEIFDRHLYQKGAAVLHMLRGDMGDARFWRSIRHYVEQNAQRNVETIDFIRAIEETTGRNLRAFFDQWVFRAGHPQIEVSAVWDDTRKLATITIDQKQARDGESSAYHFDVVLGLAPAGETQMKTGGGARVLAGERRVLVHVERARETIAIALDFEPRIVRFDPGAFILGDITYAYGPDLAAATLGGDPDVVARIRAARELVKDGTQASILALSNAFAHEPFWGVLVEAAAALGSSRAPWAQEILIGALRHAHPKVRRAAAAALGAFRNAHAASALIDAASRDESYFVRAAALESLGKTRDARAFDVLSAALPGNSWNRTVECGALRGLAELADARVVSLIAAAARPHSDEALRRSAAGAFARIGQLIEDRRSEAVGALEDLLDDPVFLVQLAALRAVESLADQRLLPALDRLAQSASDGRTRRDALEAAIRVREAAKVPAQVNGMRDDIDGLREEQQKLQEKIAALARA